MSTEQVNVTAHASRACAACVPQEATRVTTVHRARHEKASHLYIGRGRGGRPTRWGNPFPLEKPRTPVSEARCLWPYCEHVKRTGLIDEVHELRGQLLACFCAPQACHGDILAACADSDDPRRVLAGFIARYRAVLGIAEGQDVVDPVLRARLEGKMA